MPPQSDDGRSLSELSFGGASRDGFKWKSEDGSLYDDASVALKDRRTGYIPPQIAKREQRNVIISRMLVALVLTASMIGAALGTFRFVKKEEDDDFSDEVSFNSSITIFTLFSLTPFIRTHLMLQFSVYSEEVLFVIAQKIEQLLLSLDSFAVGIALEAVATNSTWPFVTVNDWPLRARKIKKLIGDETAQSFFAPCVKDVDLLDWERYSFKNAPLWYEQSIGREELPFSVQNLTEKTVHRIHTYDDDSTLNTNTSGEALPLWQYYPLSPDVHQSVLSLPFHNDALDTNNDLSTDPLVRGLFQLTTATSKPSIGTFQVSSDSTAAKSLILQPIFDPSNEEEILGVVGLSINWGNYMEDILPKEVNNLILVLRMKCMNGNGDTEAGVLTYSMNGPNAQLLGAYDGHDNEFDYIEARSTLFGFDIPSSTVPEAQCIPKISLHFYPTQLYENRFHRGKSSAYTVVVVSVFVFTTFVFLIYDFFVGRRQKKVMHRIMAQDKIVADVFPSAVRDRLYNEDGGVEDPETTRQLPRMSSHKAIDDELNVFGAAPLADLFPNTTIVFADIVGFTAWSSAREPQQVFRLLESLYMAFDKIAYRHGVFKIETVGVRKQIGSLRLLPLLAHRFLFVPARTVTWPFAVCQNQMQDMLVSVKNDALT